jgi:hypothetical protein
MVLRTSQREYRCISCLFYDDLDLVDVESTPADMKLSVAQRLWMFPSRKLAPVFV